jgi:NAD(P)-dependent dehydrogenase (short-subunit alcohol dehydrogenase family)
LGAGESGIQNPNIVIKNYKGGTQQMSVSKTIVVTGGASGIGKAIALDFAHRSFNVIIADVDENGALSTKQEIISALGNAEFVKTDVSQECDVKNLVQKTLEIYGPVHILVNSAGNAQEMKPVLEQSLEAWDRLIAIHLRGSYLCSKLFAPSMIKNGWGRIINFSSIVGYAGFPHRTAYGPAKAGINNLTKVLALEWAADNITVNAVAPGYILTPLLEKLINDGKLDTKRLESRIPLHRLGSTEDVLNAVRFLCDEASDYITGISIPVDGVWLANGAV